MTEVVRVLDIKSLQQQIIILHNHFCRVINASNENINVDVMVKLDNEVATLLSLLNLKPALKLQLHRELTALKSSHYKVLELCKQQQTRLAGLMENHTQNREGIMAYQELEI